MCNVPIEDETLMAHETTSLTTAGFPEMGLKSLRMCSLHQIPVVHHAGSMMDPSQGTNTIRVHEKHDRAPEVEKDRSKLIEE